MIRLSKIDDKLSIYKRKSVILFGAGDNGKRIKRELESKRIKVIYFCDNDQRKWGRKLDGIEIISPSYLQHIYNEDFLIQISSSCSKEIEKQLLSFKIDFFISYEEYQARMRALGIYKTLPQSLHIYKTLDSEPSYFVNQIRKECLDYAVRVKYYSLDSYNIICLPPKTGNYTVESSLRKKGGEYIRIGHCFDRITEELMNFLDNMGGGKIKIVTAVRDPIAQNISFLFQLSGNDYFCDIPEYWENGGDMQDLWDAWIAYELQREIPCYKKKVEDRHIEFSYMESLNKRHNNVVVIQNFFEKNFQPYSKIDVYDYPFDHSKGYSIIQSGNIEIFIYQLEKLNEIKDDLGKFLEISEFELVNDNVGAEKWYAQAYKQALKKLKLDREYIEYCYSSKYIEHFYSREDIEKFRGRWNKNMK